VFIVVLAAFARAAAFLGPFRRGWQWLGAWYGIQARNALRQGFVATHFAGVVNADRVPELDVDHAHRLTLLLRP